MSFSGIRKTLWLAAVLTISAAGCSQIDSGPVDEEKEPHFIQGKSRVNMMDYEGAIKAFEESLEANPHSASAHYQLAILFDNTDRVADPAAAIYHYQQCLKYDPKFQNADAIAGRIDACKQKLAENVLQLPSAPATRQQLENLTEENHRLHDQLAQWQAYYATLPAAVKSNRQPSATGFPGQQPSGSQIPINQSPEDVTQQTTAQTNNSPGAANHKNVESKTVKPRTHTVQSGETLAVIAHKEKVNLQALEEANPSVNPRKLQAGQVLNLPAP